MTDALILLTFVFALVGLVLSTVALIDGVRLHKLCSRDTYPDSYANRDCYLCDDGSCEFC